jgi:hypothetical protein
VLPLLEKGDKKDSPCQQLIAEASKSKKTGKPVATAKKKEKPGASSSSGRSAPSAAQ